MHVRHPIHVHPTLAPQPPFHAQHGATLDSIPVVFSATTLYFCMYFAPTFCQQPIASQVQSIPATVPQTHLKRPWATGSRCSLGRRHTQRGPVGPPAPDGKMCGVCRPSRNADRRGKQRSRVCSACLDSGPRPSHSAHNIATSPSVVLRTYSSVQSGICGQARNAGDAPAIAFLIESSR